MNYILILIFTINSQLGAGYIGEYESQSVCQRAAQAYNKIVKLPKGADGALVCVRKEEV